MVWLQATSRMSSWGDPTDEWRGLAPMSSHTICFPTSYGVPDIYAAYQAKAIPDAQRRECNDSEHAKVVAGMHTIFDHFEHFSTANLNDCLDMLRGYTEPSIAFDWDGEGIKLLYGQGAGAGASIQVASQQALGLPVGEVGQLYLCRPDASDTDTFIIGIIRAITKQNRQNGVNMQWFQLTDNDADKYAGTYASVLASNTRYTHIVLCCIY